MSIENYLNRVIKIEIVKEKLHEGKRKLGGGLKMKKKGSFVLDKVKYLQTLVDLGIENESDEFIRGFFTAIEKVKNGEITIGYDWEDTEQTALEDDVL